MKVTILSAHLSARRSRRLPSAACDRESRKLESVGGSGEAFLQPVAVDARKMAKMPPLRDRSARRTNCLTKTAAGR
ncbi:MAG: hypothetical protein WCB21_13210, partial [Azonexus sp.]